MKTAGSADASFLVRNAETGAGRGESLRAGAFVFVEVRERLGSDLYRIAVGSRLMTASSKAELAPGALLRAKVERLGEGLLLRTLDAGRAPADSAALAIRKAGLPVDDASRAALAALLGAGMAPEAAALARVRQAALRAASRLAASGREDGEGLVELAARMEAKGLASEESALEALAVAGDGRSGGRFGAGGDEGGGDEGGGEGAQGESPGGRGDELEAPPKGIPPEFSDEADVLVRDHALDRDFIRRVPEDELPAALGALLRAMAFRVRGGEGAGLESAEGSAGVSADSLGLFNHAKAKDGAWLLVPFRFALDSVAFAGNFRIQLPYVSGGPGRVDARFDATRGESSETWRASLSFGGGAPPSLRVAAPESGGSPRARALASSFEARMASIGCSVELGPAAEGPSGRLGGASGGGFDLDA